MKELFSFLFFALALPGLSQEPYFQQQVDYSIHVSLDDVNHTLTANETIFYRNNSPASLEVIYMHLWPNAYKNNNTALARQLRQNGETIFHFSPDKDRGFINGLDFKVDNEKVNWIFDSQYEDIAVLTLNKPLVPGETIKITTPFHVKIPVGTFSRLGHIGQQYQVTQWYPKPAVFDRDGWHEMPYLDQGEFYSEYGTFDVHIDVPKNYVVGATGDLVNESEQKWLEEKVQETEKWLNSLDEVSLKKLTDPEFPASSEERKILHFHQENIHDFAWFCDKRYRVLKGEVETPHHKNKVTSWSMFTDGQAALWGNSIGYLNDAIYFYSLWNGDYPYRQVTAVDGALSAGGGMEYPNITVIGKTTDAFSLEMVTMHEVGHNWFYGILGSNERIHPWLDEGLNSFNESRYIRHKYPKALVGGVNPELPIVHLLDLEHYTYRKQYELLYLLNARKALDQPVELPSEEYTPLNYGGIVYSKTAAVFDMLMAYLGTETVDRAMRRYFEEWKFRHPQPSDLRKILEEESKKDLSWFFEDVIRTTKIIDYKIISSKKLENGSYEVTVVNKGDIQAPVPLYGLKDSAIAGVVWFEGFKGKAVLGFPPAEIDVFKIDFDERIPEINRNNNRIKTTGIFRKTEPVKFQFLGSLDHPDKSQLFYTPILGYNKYNGLLAGVALYNNILPQKNFEYILAPMFGTKNSDLAGYAQIRRNFPVRKGIFSQLSLEISGSRFAYENDPIDLNFNKIAPAVEFTFRNRRERNPWKKNLRYRFVSTFTEDATYNLEKKDYSPETDSVFIHHLQFMVNRSAALYPSNVLVDLQVFEETAKLGITARSSVTWSPKKETEFRLFAGTFLNDTEPYNVFGFNLSGRSGYEDYMYDHVFIGRSEFSDPFSGAYSFSAQQFFESDGNFKMNTYATGFKNLGTLNVTTNLPFIPRIIKVYADLMLFGETFSFGKLRKSTYSGGINISLKKDVIEFYLPLFASDNIGNPFDLYDGNFVKNIRFIINFSKMNPFHLVRNIQL